MQIIRTGVTRTVLLTRRHAIKVPSFRGGMHDGIRGRLASLAHGVLSNLSEYQWHNFEDWQGGVAPVLHSWLGGLVQVYPRCEPLPDDWAGELPVLVPDPGDPKPNNYGLLGGRIVRLDYDMR